ncbi:MAG: hypothetical protein KJN93_03530, partial [Alphaproteobacteria bacterium]|nr:hypothetical protein [Alphaproteobacteria bacterium]
MALTFRSRRHADRSAKAAANVRKTDAPLRLENLTADPRFLDAITPEFAIRNDVLPLRREGAVTLVAAPDQARFQTTRPTLEAHLGPVAYLASNTKDLRAAIARAASPSLA